MHWIRTTLGFLPDFWSLHRNFWINKKKERGKGNKGRSKKRDWNSSRCKRPYAAAEPHKFSPFPDSGNEIPFRQGRRLCVSVFYDEFSSHAGWKATRNLPPSFRLVVLSAIFNEKLTLMKPLDVRLKSRGELLNSATVNRGCIIWCGPVDYIDGISNECLGPKSSLEWNTYWELFWGFSVRIYCLQYISEIMVWIRSHPSRFYPTYCSATFEL